MGGKGESRLDVGEGERETSRDQMMKGLGCQAWFWPLEPGLGLSIMSLDDQQTWGQVPRLSSKCRNATNAF